MHKNIKISIVFGIAILFIILIMPQIFFMNNNASQPVLNNKIEQLERSGIESIPEDVNISAPPKTPIQNSIPQQENINEQLRYDILYKQYELLLSDTETFLETYNPLIVFYNDLSNYYYNIIPDDQKQHHIEPMFNNIDTSVIEYELVSIYFTEDIETYDSLKIKHGELIKYNSELSLFYIDVLEHTELLYIDYNAQDRQTNMGIYLGGGNLNTTSINDNLYHNSSVNELQSINNIHPDSKKGIVTDIVDGDTLYFSGNKYRLALIDTYETDEIGGIEATNALLELCPIGSIAYMEDDSIQTFDKYERYLGVIWCIGNDYNVDAGEYLYDQGYLKRFYTTYCEKTESATQEWASESNNWFYYNKCT